MGIAERRQRHKQSLRREILGAARQMFVDEGFEAVTMRKIADRIEYSPTTIYLHFKDKSELFNAICEDTFRELEARLDKLAAKQLPPLEFLRQGLRLYVDFGLKHPSHYTLTFTHTPKQHQDYSYETSIGRQAFEHLRAAVAACAASGDVEGPDVDLTAQSLWCACHGVVSLLVAHDGFPFVAPRKLTDHVIDTMIQGLTRR
jgi:AcrR family transcriptional regulator